MEQLTSIEQWQEWLNIYSLLPFMRKYKMSGKGTPSWQLAWEMASDSSFVLESGKSGRYTFLGLHAVSMIRGNGNQGQITNYKQDPEQPHDYRVDGKPLEVVKEWMKPFTAPRVAHAPKFTGGCVGFWGYDVIRSIERLPQLAKADLAEIPDYCFIRIEELWVLDHQTEELFVIVMTPVRGQLDRQQLEGLYSQAAQRAARMFELWNRIHLIHGTAAGEQFSRRKQHFELHQHSERLQVKVEGMPGLIQPFTKPQFLAAVRAIQNYIAQGDVFQVNLSLRQSIRCLASPEELYESLRMLNPSPYMGFFRFGDFQLVSASPELLVKLEGQEVETRPIAGTRRRGKHEQEDRQLADELIHHEKERAEHVMLVDLLRNDLGRISAYGSVRVHDFMVIEYYSHVMHIVSGIKGLLAEGKDAYDVIEAVFPGGTITGAPKIRTMEIIEELEPTRRGPYTGAMGWIDYTGNMEFNIIIRTLTMKDQMAHIQAGAGIVIDSEPEQEYAESLNKAKALWKAIQYSEMLRQEAQTGGEPHGVGD